MDPLLKLAAAAAQNGYAPYSGFKVGAAVECLSGETSTGNNQEVASYGLTICAERVALATLFAKNPNAKVQSIAIYSPNAKEGIVRPCGACREYIAECAKRSTTDIKVIMADCSVNISELLPLPFEL